jgi:hypothetical protein
MKKCLVSVIGHLGDTLWSSSCSKPLKEEQNFDQIDYLIGFPQTKPILEQNHYIDRVFVQTPHTAYVNKNFVPNLEQYDTIYELPVNDLSVIPTILYQKTCGIVNVDKAFPCKLPPEFVSEIGTYVFKFGICHTWKTYYDTLRNPYELLQMFESRCDDYFGRNSWRHDVKFVIIGNGCSQHEGANDVDGYLRMGQLMMSCDAVLGAEGGLLNLASSLGVDTICATDFTKGLNDRMYHVDDIFDKLTPSAFFCTNKHENLDSKFDTNESIVEEMFQIILKKYL